jgi:hypothetical protein
MDFHMCLKLLHFNVLSPKICLGFNSCVITFTNHVNVAMCIHFRKCPTVRRFSTNHFGGMATNQGLDWHISACGCCCSWFMCPLILMVVDYLTPLNDTLLNPWLVPSWD